MKTIHNAQKELDSLKKEVIGIYKHSTLGLFELVLKYDEDNKTMNTVFISQFGAIQKGFNIPLKGQLCLFDREVSMYDLLAYPHAWDTFLKQFI